RHRLDVPDEVEVLLEVVALKPRTLTPVIVRREIVRRAVASREEPATERTVGDERDPELAAQREQFVFRIAAPHRVLGLQRRDRMHRRRAPDRRRSRLRQAEETNLAGAHEIRHRADRLFDRDVRVDAVLVIEIDRVDLQALQRRVARLADVLRRSVDAEELALLAAHVPELRRDDDGVAAAADRAADEPLVRERTVHVGRVEKVDPEIDRAMDRRDRFLVVAAGVELRHPHAAETDGGDPRSAGSECALFHPFIFAETRPAAIQPSRVSSEPASAATLAALRQVGFFDVARINSGTGPDSTPPARIIQPLGPSRSGAIAGVDRVSTNAPMTVSAAAAPMATSFSAGSSCPISVRIAAAEAIPDAAKCGGSSRMFSCQTGIAVAPMRTPV